MTNDENIFEEISDAEEETELNKQFSELLFKLEKDLQQLKSETEEDLVDHLHDLEELKKIAMLPVININDITWFLESPIFVLMREIPEEFSIKPLAIYECMLERIGSFPKDDNLKHKDKLLSLKNKENSRLSSLLLLKKELEKRIEKELEIKKQNPIQSFFQVLNTKKRSLEESSISSIPSKRIKLLPASPLALQSNGLFAPINYGNHENLQSPSGMKLS